jgi:nitroimidazol reductase NimA-like FMN-containing flavoprotein (pyridoxamine 5'-phosphate oxidase superfamily)
MHESPDEIARLQALLDASYEKAGAHLKSIITPKRRLSAEEVCAELQGMTLLSLATVNSRCEPIVGPVDGIFFRGLLWFGSAENSLRFRHLRARPQVSATHTRGEELVVTVHGVAREIDKASGKFEDFRECLREVYGPQWESWGYWETAPYAWIEPRVMFAASFKGLTQQ